MIRKNERISVGKEKNEGCQNNLKLNTKQGRWGEEGRRGKRVGCKCKCAGEGGGREGKREGCGDGNDVGDTIGIYIIKQTQREVCRYWKKYVKYSCS